MALYVPHFDPRPAGLGTYVHEMCGRMIARAERVVLYTETPDTVPAEWRDRVRVRVIPSARVALRSARLLAREVWLSTVLPIELEREHVDALFVPFHDGMIRPSIPQIVVVHDLTPLVVPSRYFHALSRLHLRAVLPRVLRRSTVVAVSESTRRDLERLLGVDPSRVHVIGEGYDREVYRPRSAEEIGRTLARLGIDGPYLLYSGTYAAHKNPMLLADILKGCAIRGTDLRLVLSGRHDAGEYGALRESLREHGLAGRVIAPGYVPRPELSMLMAGATAFVYPSLYEGFGLAPLEAMASGAVVVSSTRASLPEVVGDGGILCDPASPDEWVTAVTRVATDAVLAADLRERALARAARFSWDDAAESLWKLVTSRAGDSPKREHRRPSGNGGTTAHISSGSD